MKKLGIFLLTVFLISACAVSPPSSSPPEETEPPRILSDEAVDQIDRYLIRQNVFADEGQGAHAFKVQRESQTALRIYVQSEQTPLVDYRMTPDEHAILKIDLKQIVPLQSETGTESAGITLTLRYEQPDSSLTAQASGQLYLMDSQEAFDCQWNEGRFDDLTISSLTPEQQTAVLESLNQQAAVIQRRETQAIAALGVIREVLDLRDDQMQVSPGTYTATGSRDVVLTPESGLQLLTGDGTLIDARGSFMPDGAFSREMTLFQKALLAAHQIHREFDDPAALPVTASLLEVLAGSSTLYGMDDVDRQQNVICLSFDDGTTELKVPAELNPHQEPFHAVKLEDVEKRASELLGKTQLKLSREELKTGNVRMQLEPQAGLILLRTAWEDEEPQTPIQVIAVVDQKETADGLTEVRYIQGWTAEASPLIYNDQKEAVWKDDLTAQLYANPQRFTLWKATLKPAADSSQMPRLIRQEIETLPLAES